MLQSFKKIGLAVLLTTLSTLPLEAQSTQQKKPKKHTCTKKCCNKGKCQKMDKTKTMDVAKKMDTSDMQLKDHVCTASCHSTGKCVIAHGEKGHTCDASCKM